MDLGRWKSNTIQGIAVIDNCNDDFQESEVHVTSMQGEDEDDDDYDDEDGGTDDVEGTGSHDGDEKGEGDVKASFGDELLQLAQIE